MTPRDRVGRQHQFAIRTATDEQCSLAETKNGLLAKIDERNRSKFLSHLKQS